MKLPTLPWYSSLVLLPPLAEYVVCLWVNEDKGTWFIDIARAGISGWWYRKCGVEMRQPDYWCEQFYDPNRQKFTINDLIEGSNVEEEKSSTRLADFLL